MTRLKYDKLVDCPFCQSDDLEMRGYIDDDVREWRNYVECNKCEATGPIAISPDTAAISWNKRC